MGGIEAGGGVLIRTVLVSFMDCFDDELPVFDVGVFFVIGVALPLLVEASGGFDLSVPVGEVEMGGVEFFGPDEFPIFGGGRHMRLNWYLKLYRNIKYTYLVNLFYLFQ